MDFYISTLHPTNNQPHSTSSVGSTSTSFSTFGKPSPLPEVPTLFQSTEKAGCNPTNQQDSPSTSAQRFVPQLSRKVKQYSGRRPRQPQETPLFADVSDSGSDNDEPESKRKTKAKQYAREQAAIDAWVRELGFDPVQNPDHNIVALALTYNEPVTVLQYASQLRQITESGHSKTWRGLVMHIAERLDGNGRPMSAGTIGQYRSSMLNYLNAIGANGEEAQARAALKGLQRKVRGSNVRRRGGITYEKVRDMIKSENKLAVIHKRAFTLLSATGVRQNQLVDMRLNEWQLERTEPSGKKVWRVTVRRNKKGVPTTAPGYDTDFEDHLTNPDWSDDIDEILADTKKRTTAINSNPYLLVNWNAAQARKEVRRLAKKLNWPEALQWVLHSFRHGAAIDAFLKNADRSVVDALKAVQEKTGHISIEMIRYYCEPNEDRERYVNMKMDDGVLRLTKVVQDTNGRFFERHGVNGPAAPQLTARDLGGVVNKAKWKIRLEKDAKKKKARNKKLKNKQQKQRRAAAAKATKKRAKKAPRQATKRKK